MSSPDTVSTESKTVTTEAHSEETDSASGKTAGLQEADAMTTDDKAG